MTHTGWLDGASYTRAWGWATAPVAIRVNGKLAATVAPDTARPGLPEGGVGFETPVDPFLFVRGANEVTASIAETGAAIGKGPVRLDLSASPEFISGCSIASIARGLWTFSHVRQAEDRITIEGWGVAPPGVASASLFSDGETLRYSARPDASLQAQTWLPPETPVHRFEAEFRFRAPVLKVWFGAQGRAFDPDQDCLIPRDISAQPGKEGIRRVAGGGDPLKFDMQGLTAAARLRSTVVRHAKTPLDKSCVLDWGVGAGRVARFLAPHAGAFHGVDIDADNLAWCRDHLQGDYLHIGIDPPTPLPSGRFDFIYGISVVTHLACEYEKAWLAELRRLIKDDGIVALSIHGATALMVMGLCHRQAELSADGFVDLGENRVLAGRAPDGYYRNVAQSFAHLHNVWGEFFTVADVMPGAIGLQDLVVLRPR